MSTGPSLLIVESSESITLIETMDSLKKTVDVEGRMLRPLGGGVTYLLVTGTVEAISGAAAAVRSMDALAVDKIRMDAFLHPVDAVWDAIGALTGLDADG